MDIWVVSTFLAIMNNVVVNIHVQVLCRWTFFLRVYLVVELLGHIVALYLIV